MFSTHPRTEERIAILRGMAHGEGRRLVPQSALADQTPVPIRQAASKPTQAQRLQQAHEALDTVRRLNDFLFIACACGATLKIPPSSSYSAVTCPRCRRSHNLSEAKPRPQPAPPSAPPSAARGARVIHCSCGNDIPIPPGYSRPRAFCPKCNKNHDLSKAQPA